MFDRLYLPSLIFLIIHSQSMSRMSVWPRSSPKGSLPRRLVPYSSVSSMLCLVRSALTIHRTVSNVTGEGLSLLRSFLNFVPTASEGGDESFPLNADFEFSVSDVFSVPFVGSVVSGVILAG